MLKTSISTRGGKRAKQIAEKMVKKAKEPKALRVGFFSTARYANGDSVAGVAASHEFGVGVPERPFFRQALEPAKKDAAKVIKRFTRAEELLPDAQTLNKVGEIVIRHIQKRIHDLRFPPNSPKTIAKKGGKDNPLIETGKLINSVGKEIVRKS